MARIDETVKTTIISALALEKDGMDFYSRASKIASDPRARTLFQKMADDRSYRMKLLGSEYKTLMKRSPPSEEALSASHQPSVYPKKAIEPIVCSVCGEELKGWIIPNECPACGASSYAFQRDIPHSLALEMAIESQRRSLDFYLEKTQSINDPRIRGVLERLADMEQASLKNLQDEYGYLKPQHSE